ncbi:MAG: tetratricopeptide repeat protein, partial [Pseudomonadota bacterium]
MSKKYFLFFVLLVVACQIIFPVSVWPETFSMKIDNLKSQLNNKLPSTVLNILLEVMKTEKQIKEPATLEDVEQTELAKKVLARLKKGEFVAYVSGADGKPYVRFILDNAYVGSRIQIPFEGNPPPEQIEFVLESLAKELIKNETKKPIKSEKKQMVSQDAMARGLAAAKQQDFVLAVKYFNQAKAADLYSPHVQFNLALAYEKAGGKELLAIASYRSFLAIAPQAANAEQVRKKTIDLEIRVESNIQKLIQTAKDASLTLDNYFEREAATTEHYQYLKRIWGKKAAEEEKKWYIDNESQKPLEALSMAQVKAGD